MNVADNKCLSCGAPLEFNVQTQNWVCSYCKKIYNIEDLQHNIDKFNNIKTNDLEIFECKDCGAKVIGDESTSATKCIYCGNSVIIKKRLEGVYKPDYIITFKRSIDEIKTILSKNLKSKKLSDNNFGNIENIKEINKLYVPYWLFTGDVMASIRGIVYVQGKNRDYNKNCYRLGIMKFDRVPADAKRNLNDDLLQGVEPFNYNELVTFEYPYLAGMMAECYDQNEEEIIKSQIKSRVEEAAEDKLKKTIRAGNSISVTERSTFIKKDKFEYVLVPIWFVKLEYNGKIYEFCVNDQTGKVAGKRQLNSIKVLLMYGFCILFTAITGYFALIQNNLGEFIFYLLMILYITLFGSLSVIVSSYKKINKGKKSSDYVTNGTFQLMDANDQDGY